MSYSNTFHTYTERSILSENNQYTHFFNILIVYTLKRNQTIPQKLTQKANFQHYFKSEPKCPHYYKPSETKPAHLDLAPETMTPPHVHIWD